jgi:uncharacterized membrane protein
VSQPDLSRLEHQIGSVLRVGVALSAGALIVGLALFFAASPWAGALLNAGLVLLMAIPVTRIIASFIDGCRRRDWLLVWATAFVLVVMAATLAYSLRNRG